jgi:hypothetical protein
LTFNQLKHIKKLDGVPRQKGGFIMPKKGAVPKGKPGKIGMKGMPPMKGGKK